MASYRVGSGGCAYLLWHFNLVDAGGGAIVIAIGATKLVTPEQSSQVLSNCTSTDCVNWTAMEHDGIDGKSGHHHR